MPGNTSVGLPGRFEWHVLGCWDRGDRSLVAGGQVTKGVCKVMILLKIMEGSTHATIVGKADLELYNLPEKGL